MITSPIFGPSLSKENIGTLRLPLALSDGETIFRRYKGKSCIEQEFKGRLGYLQQYNIVTDESLCIRVYIPQSDLYVIYLIRSKSSITLYDSKNKQVFSLQHGRALYAYLPEGIYQLHLPPGKYHLFIFYFDVGMFDDGAESEYTFLRRLLESHRRSSYTPMVSAKFNLDPRTEAYIHALCLGIKTGNLSSQIFMFEKMKELIMLSKANIEEEYEPTNYKRTIAQAAKIILQSNLETAGIRYKLTAVADQLAISLNYLQIIFKSETGGPLSQFKARIIVDKAKKMMETGRTPKETSQLCGFENLSAFYRFFKREAQITPKDYISSQSNRTKPH